MIIVFIRQAYRCVKSAKSITVSDNHTGAIDFHNPVDHTQAVSIGLANLLVWLARKYNRHLVILQKASRKTSLLF